MKGRCLPLFVAIVMASGCSSPQGGRSSAAPSTSAITATPTNSPTQARYEPKSWRKPRYISVAAAVDRLRPRIEVPIVLPRDRLAGLPNLKGWMVDPKYLDVRRVGGLRVGTLVLRKKDQILHINYGYSTFDGCGGADTAIETNVAGQPALLSTSTQDIWSHLMWPVSPGGSTGRYGLIGTFEGWELIRLAESMEAARGGDPAADTGC